MLDVLLFGSLGAYVAQQDGSSKAGAPYLLAGILMFHVLYQLQIAICTGFMEETWSRNVLNIMTTPVTEGEYVAGVAVFGLAKLVVAMVVLTLMALLFFGFNLAAWAGGWCRSPRCCCCAGWSIGITVIGLMLRYGQSAEILAWGINFLVMALSGVFNPVDAIPGPAAADLAHPADDPRLHRAEGPARRQAPAVGTDRRRARGRVRLRRRRDLVRHADAAHVPPARLRHPFLVDAERGERGDHGSPVAAAPAPAVMAATVVAAAAGTAVVV